MMLKYSTYTFEEIAWNLYFSLRDFCKFLYWISSRTQCI